MNNNKNVHHISLGHDCQFAMALNIMGLRKCAYPFDFILTDANLGLKYVATLIDNNFCDFLDDLEYNSKNRVRSKKYPNTSFPHHDFIKNRQSLVKSLTIDRKNMEVPLIDKFKIRAKRLMDIILDPNNKCYFYYKQSSKNISNKLFESSLYHFANTMNSMAKCKYTLIISVYGSPNDIEMQCINSKFNQLNIYFELFVGDNNDEDNRYNMQVYLDKFINKGNKDSNG